MPSPQKFVLLSMSRTGSNALVSTLDSHPQIECFGEIFNRSPNEKSRLTTILPNLEMKYSDTVYRNTHYMDYINAIFELYIKMKFIGFKLMLTQNIKARDDLIKDANYKKIFLYRENELACYSSKLIAEETGQGSASVIRGDVVRTAIVPFDTKEFASFCKRREYLYKETRQLLAQQDQEYIDIEYKDAITSEGTGRVIAFIGADLHFITELGTLKRNTSNIVERFTQPDEVMTYLKSIGKEEWA